MTKITSRSLHSIALLLGALSCPVVALAAGQFHATLDNPPRVVSDYFHEIEPFSAAIGSKSYAAAMPGLRKTARFLGADFDHHSLEFNTTYFLGKSLVPISVDADQFLNFRIRSLHRRRMSEFVLRGIVTEQQSQRRTGLSVGINLPKRFDNVFGEGGANLKVTGFRRISFSGRSQWTDGADVGLFKQSRFPSLDMKQIFRFNISGTIGTKISVKVSQDSQTDIPLANRLQLRYIGDDDDILQLIEAGNTNLALPNTKFVGYSSRIQGLFGIKAEAQFGNLHLTAIASQEKGSTERTTISSSSEENVKYIRDYQYAQGKIFDLPSPRADGTWGKNDVVRQLYVFEHDESAGQIGENSAENPFAKLFVNSVIEDSLTLDRVRVKELEGKEFWWIDDAVRNYHYVVFSSLRRRGLAVYMEASRFDDNGVSLGDTIIGFQPVDSSDYELRLIRAIGDEYNVNHPTWDMMWRNVYSMPRGVSVEDLKLKIFKGAQNAEASNNHLDYQKNGTKTQQYITILGLDQINEGTGVRVPDNFLDERIEVYNPDWGLLIFPEREPFNSSATFTDANGKETEPLTTRISTLYHYTSNSPSERTEYYIQISTAGSRSSSIRLNRANIIEGSERITVNGRLLTRGVDYNIQYDFGQVTLLSDDALDPNAELNIDFEFAPFLAVQKKTLLGIRAEYDFSDDLKFGTTILYKSDKAQDRKPRVGQETSEALVLDFDISLRLRPNFLTDVVDALPFISTEAPSTMQIVAEIAQSRPNPNVEGQAYIDDFESAIEHISLGFGRTIWHKAARPPISELLPLRQRGRLLWHQSGRVLWEEVYDSKVAPGQGGIVPFRIIFFPDNDFRFMESAGQAVRIVDSTTDTTGWWGGITRYFGSRLDEKRLQLFEMRVRSFGRQGILHLDFGSIKEDLDGNNQEDFEDRDANNSVSLEEDIGLDKLADEDEISSDNLVYNANTNPDPEGDNWYHQGVGNCPLPASLCNNSEFIDQLSLPSHPLFYEWLNGTDGNREDVEFFQQPDKEKLSNSSFSKTDDYFSFLIKLSDTADSPFRVDSSRSDSGGWVTYQIPIRDTSLFLGLNQDRARIVGNPRWSDITHIRVWYESDPLAEPQFGFDAIDIATWGFIQSNWQDSLVSTSSQSSFFVASVSEDENAEFDNSGIPYEPYVSPIDNIAEPRRALSLNYSGLKVNDTGFATKSLVSSESYTGYRRLEMYVHAPSDLDSNSVEFFFRLGSDEENFYEFFTILNAGWDTANNSVNIDFNDITALKDAYLRNNGLSEAVDTSSGNYRILGRPNLNEIRYFSAGIINVSADSTAIDSGAVWIDELRLTDVRKDVGTASRLTVTGSLADLVRYNFNIEHKDPYFRGLSSVTRGGGNNNLGSGQTNDRIGYSTTISFDKFLPRSWKANLPVTVSYNKNTFVPLVRTRTDIVLPEEVRDSLKSETISRSFRISEKFNKKGNNLLFSVLLNRQDMSFSYNRTDRISPTIYRGLSETINIRSSYRMGIRNMPTIPIFFWAKSIPILKKISQSRLGIYPETWRWSGTFNRNLSLTEVTKGVINTTRRRDLTGRMNLSYRMFDNLSTTFTYNTRRDISDPKLVNISISDIKLGLETNFGQSFKADYAPKLLSFLTGSFNYSATYNDNYDRSSKTNRSDLSQTKGVGGKFDHIALFGGKTRSTNRSGIRKTGSSGRSLRATTVKKKPFYDKPLSALRLLTGWINPFSYRFSQSFNNSVPSMLERPSLRYRLGLTRKPDVAIGVGDTRNPSSSQTNSFDLSSGFTLFGGITTDVKYRRQISEDLIKIGDKSKQISTSWPDLKIRIRRFKNFPLIKNYINKVIDVFSPRTAYSRSVRETFNLSRGFATRKTESINRNPLLQINLKLIRQLSLSGSYTLKQENTEKFNQTNGSSRAESRSTRKTIAVSTKYSFSAPGGIVLPLFGRVKFSSTVSIDVNIRFNSNKTETTSPGIPNRVTLDRSDIVIEPIISYTFSRQIKGGLSARWQDTNDRLLRKSHTRQLQIWTEIRF